MSNFIQRTLSGAIYVSVVIGSILLLSKPCGIYAFTALCTVVAMLAAREFHLLTHSSLWERIVSMVLAGCAVAATGLLKGNNNDDAAAILFTFYIFAFPIYLISELFTKADNPVQNWGNFFISQLMIAFPFALLTTLTQKPVALLALFVIIWVNDSGAYCVGSLSGKYLGNHKMFPRVSPGKSWEGLIGGLTFALLTGYIFFLYRPVYTLWQWLLIAVVISLFGTLGDLMESLMKRTLGVKDSGKFLPGHGGVLDRFDSILMATPSLLLLLIIFHFI